MPGRWLGESWWFRGSPGTKNTENPKLVPEGNLARNPTSDAGHGRELADGHDEVLLSMLGIHGPPLYGLTAEEVRARSLP